MVSSVTLDSRININYISITLAQLCLSLFLVTRAQNPEDTDIFEWQDRSILKLAHATLCIVYKLRGTPRAKKPSYHIFSDSFLGMAHTCPRWPT